jgi:hypothetical protein
LRSDLLHGSLRRKEQKPVETTGFVPGPRSLAAFVSFLARCCGSGKIESRSRGAWRPSFNQASPEKIASEPDLRQMNPVVVTGIITVESEES